MGFVTGKIGSQIRILTPLFLLAAAFWAIRIVLGAAGAPSWLLATFSATVVIPLTVFLATLGIYARKEASYGAVLISALFLVSFAQLLICSTILFSLLTGIHTIYTAPEFSPFEQPGHVLHLLSHLLAIPVGTLFGFAMGGLVLWVLRKMVPTDQTS